MNSTQHIRGLDGLRAISVIAVVWHHSHPGFSAAPIFQRGFLGVDVFFVLSGFLITTLMLLERERTGQLSLKRFYIRRTLRIFPLYYAVLLGLAAYFYVVAVPGSSTRDAYFSELIYHLTYTSNWFETETFMAITWSLSTEEQFYLLWPPLFVVFGRWVLVPLTGFLVLNQAINFGLLDTQLTQLGIPYAKHEILQATFTPIILGVLAAYSRQSVDLRQRLNSLLARSGVVWAIILFAMLAANAPGDIRGWPRLSFHIAITLLIMALVLQPKHIVVWLLERPTIAYVGTISYGIYLLHMVAIDFTSRAMMELSLESKELKFAAAGILSVVMAGFSFRFFEQPILRYKNRFRVTG